MTMNSKTGDSNSDSDSAIAMVVAIAIGETLLFLFNRRIAKILLIKLREENTRFRNPLYAYI